MSKIKLPALCFGTNYYSADQVPITDLGSGEALATIGHVVPERIGSDVIRKGLLLRGREKLRAIPIAKRIEMAEASAEIFEQGTVECGGQQQSPEDYRGLLSRTSGLSHKLADINTSRVAAALRMTGDVISGLSRGLPYEAFDTGIAKQGGATVRIVPRIDGLGCCMPNNSPGVHVTWAAAAALGFPVLVRPGSAEPFTPYRMIKSLIKAGYPIEAFGFYPTSYAGADKILDVTGGGITFGDDSTVNKWKNYPLIQVHGAGYSKLIIGEDRIENWKSLIPQLAQNIAANSGRSCFTISRLIVPRYGREIAEVLAKALASIVPKPLEDPEAMLSAISMPAKAKWSNNVIEDGLKKAGAVDISAQFRNAKRLEVFEGRTYLHPTIIHCDSSSHDLANREFLFPYCAVVESSNDQAFMELGKTLSLAVYTHEQELKQRAADTGIALVSINAPTSKLDRCQPHQENLFELFYQRLSYVEA